MKKLLSVVFLMCFISCSNNNTESKVADVIEKHPDAHSILFYDPSTTIITEGDKTEELQRLDYIAFSNGYVRIKFLGKEELTLELKNEPSFSTNGAIFYYPKNEDYSFSINLRGSTFFFEKDGKFVVSNFTSSNEMKTKEYINILNNTNAKTPPVLHRLLEATDHRSESYYSFD